MNELKPSQAIGMWLLTTFVLFLVASLLSWSFNDWNWLSRIIFWGPTIIFGIWTISDHFINPEK